MYEIYKTVCFDPTIKKAYPSDVIRQLTMMVKVNMGDEIYDLWKQAILSRVNDVANNLDAYRDLAEEACAKYYALLITPSDRILSDPQKFIEPIVPPTPTFRFINLDIVRSVAESALNVAKSDFLSKDVVELSWNIYTNLFLLAETVKLLRGTEFEEELKKDGITPDELLKPCNENVQLYDCVQELMQRIVRTSTKLLIYANLKV